MVGYFPPLTIVVAHKPESQPKEPAILIAEMPEIGEF